MVRNKVTYIAIKSDKTMNETSLKVGAECS